jgi:hypothetical protein
LPLVSSQGAPERIECYTALPPVDRPDRDQAVGPEHEPSDPATDLLVQAHAGVQPVAEQVVGDILLPVQLAAVEWQVASPACARTWTACRRCSRARDRLSAPPTTTAGVPAILNRRVPSGRSSSTVGPAVIY